MVVDGVVGVQWPGTGQAATAGQNRRGQKVGHGLIRLTIYQAALAGTMSSEQRNGGVLSNMKKSSRFDVVHFITTSFVSFA